MEKSLLSFAATYPDWLPGPGAAELLSAVGPAAMALPQNGARGFRSGPDNGI